MNYEFSNPENLPVDQLTLNITNNGVLLEIKALDSFWVEKRNLIMYEKPPLGSEMVLGAVATWKSKMEGYLENLKWLLSLQHHKFWSTILYHPNCMDCLVSFLQEANPPYMEPYEIRDVQKLYAEIRRLVLIIFSRLITNKESKSQWMSKDYMSELLYDNFIFTIPIIWDICLVYGVDNAQHVSRLLDGVFMLQSQFEKDALAALSFVNEAFKYIILQVNKDYDCDEPPNLPETFKGFHEIRRPPDSSKSDDKLSFDMLKDIIIHMLDTSMTLRIFLEVYPKGVELYRKTNILLSTVQLYEYAIPQLYEKLQLLGDETSVLYSLVEGYIDSARAELIDIFREMLAVYKNAILNAQGNIASHVEDYLAVMIDGLSERLLIRDYNACYPVNEDMEMLRQAYPEIDSVKTDFILQAIYSNLDEPLSDNKNITTSLVSNGHIENGETIDNGPGPSRDNDTPDNDIPDNVKEESLISEVKDILPHLGDGFILQCLKYYGFKSERVINSILEDNLAESLRGLDQSLPIIPEDPIDNKFLETGIERLNIFDGDKFDIMTRDDVDLSKIHVGKTRSKYKNTNEMLNDKTDVRNLADLYSKYSVVCDETALYSDEYDDTYDSDGAPPPGDVTAAEELRRPMVTPRVLLAPRTRHEEESESDPEPQEQQSSTQSSSHNRLDFCVNPEEIRAKREANMQARKSKGHRAPPPQNVDVVGKPKGKGQEKEVLVNRDKKEKNKSGRANHNRKQGASWKRSRGIVPM